MRCGIVLLLLATLSCGAPEPHNAVRLFPRSGVGAARIGATAYVVGGTGVRREQVNALLSYDLEKGEWTERGRLPERISFPACVAFGRKLYVFGGLHDDGSSCGHARVYDPATDRWKELAPMPTPRSRATATVGGGRIYVAGGIEKSDKQAKNSDVVEVYDPARDRWSRIAPMHLARHGHVAAFVDRKLVVAGGYLGAHMDLGRSVEIWDGRSWSQGADLPGDRGFSSAVVFNDEIWVFGNRGGAPHPVRYDPARDRWTESKAPGTRLHRAGAVRRRGEVWFFFGEEAGGRFVRRFDLRRDAWVDG